MSQLRGGFIQRRDPLRHLPASVPEWSMVRSNLMMRLRVAALNIFMESKRPEAARKLKAEIGSKPKRAAR